MISTEDGVDYVTVHGFIVGHVSHGLDEWVAHMDKPAPARPFDRAIDILEGK